MDIIPAAGQALSVLGSIDSVSRLASVARNIGTTATSLSSLGKRIRDEREQLRNLRTRVRQHESSNSSRTMAPNRRRAKTIVRRRPYTKRWPTDARPSPFKLPRNLTIAQCLGKEVKHIIVNSTSLDSTTDTDDDYFHCAKTTGTTLLETLIPIARGTGDNEREARGVCLQYTSIKGLIKVASQSQASMANLDGMHMTVLLVLDRQASEFGFPANGNGTPDDQINGLYEVGGSIPAPYQPIDQDDKQRFKVLKRKDFVLNHGTVWNDSSSYRTPSMLRKFKMFIRYNGLEAIYQGSTGNADELVSNNLFVLIGFRNPNTHGWTVQFTADTAFTG